MLLKITDQSRNTHGNGQYFIICYFVMGTVLSGEKIVWNERDSYSIFENKMFEVDEL